MKKCAWPKCASTSTTPIATIGENSGPRVYACDQHYDRIALTKSVLGAASVTAFQVGMDKAAPGLREKIYDAGTAIMSVWNGVQAARNKNATQ